MDNLFDFRSIIEYGFTNEVMYNFADNLLYLLYLDASSSQNCIQGDELDFYILFVREIFSSLFKNMVVRDNVCPVVK